MEEIAKEYTNGEVTIVWKPKKCFHSTTCIKGLPEVFNATASPWINASGAATERIIEQVRKCPSGALSYYMNEELAASGLQGGIEVLTDGPYQIHGKIRFTSKDGRTTVKENIFLCRCGASKKKPFCDGTHHQIGFKD
jgi:uncharacterized Fe-S cluster protein YjdI